jgi:hypothetical protein
MMCFKRTFVFVALICSLMEHRAQELLVYENNIGFTFGINAALGTHFQRFGFNLNFFYARGQFQANSELRMYYSFRDLGPGRIHPELVFTPGLLFAYGGMQNGFNPFLSPVSNQTRYRNSIAYAYHLWFNNIGTTQQTGAIALQFSEFSVIAENDLLASPGLDRFRTGAFLFQYQYDNIWQFAVNCSMWTGKFGWKKMTNEVSRFPNSCYMDTIPGKYTEVSHGLLSAQVKYYAGLAQNVQGNIGIDSERIRNTVQNRIMHDMRFLPQKWIKRKNCHIPMLDENGKIYLYRGDQKIRKAKSILNLFTNASLFY